MNINLTMLMQAAVFVALIIFCAKLIWPPLMRAIEARQKEIADGLAAAEQGKKDLSAAEKRIEEMLLKARTQAQDIVSQGERQKVESVEKGRTEAREEAARIVAAARAEVEQEFSRAKEKLRDQVAELAVAGAAKILEREVDPKTHAALLTALKQQL
ncbi:MAG: F0F1 ATP synthase subunit B [Burkholderiales bacterium]|jgi:F-type H+-transporting ATPase subunit b|nr:F0F1 ATP synthase subunit B [Burkholderiales bacterium]